MGDCVEERKGRGRGREEVGERKSRGRGYAGAGLIPPEVAG